MNKYHIDDWQNVFLICKNNRKKLLFNPFYTKKKFITDNYKQQLNRTPNLSHPTSFAEKQNVLKLSKQLCKNYYKYADKHLVRNYVAEKIGKKYLIPELLYTKKITVKDLKRLPNQFVLKTTNGSGTNYIVSDKKSEDLQKVADYINWLSKLKYGYLWGEFFYNKITPGIVAEKLLLDKKGHIPDDLKCYCFKNSKGEKHKIFYIERVIGDDRRRIMFNENWEPVDYNANFGKLNIKLKKPKNYQEILKVVDALSEDFNFVRVDLFVLDGKIYFGELTFVPTAGYMKFNDNHIDELWGSWTT